MARWKKIIAAALTPVLGMTTITVQTPAAHAEEQKVQINFKCSITTSGLNSFKSSADGIYGDGFGFTATVVAPTEAEAGKPFEYILKPGFVGVPNPIKMAVDVNIDKIERARVSVLAPENATVQKVELSGGQSDLQVVQEGNKYSLSGGDTTDSVNAHNEAEIKMIGTGATGSIRGGKIGVDLPDIKITMVGNTAGKDVRPVFPQVKNMNEKPYPAETSFFSTMAQAHASVLFLTYTAVALVRCSPTDAHALPAVHITAAREETPSESVNEVAPSTPAGEGTPSESAGEGTPSEPASEVAPSKPAGETPKKDTAETVAPVKPPVKKTETPVEKKPEKPAETPTEKKTGSAVWTIIATIMALLSSQLVIFFVAAINGFVPWLKIQK